MNLFSTRRTNATRQGLDDATVHAWYRFVLSYPDHLVKDMLAHFAVQRGQIVLDPFVGTGTTLVECKRAGIRSIGVDANPVTAFASQVKTDWDIDLVLLDEQISQILATIE
ncbi:MAG TPA: DNA methyltransferase, partial [Anaerolineae bacterium]|nr:DNA methyltransferase [Anaerolineae bacterium]